jgi:hypothetical protein
MQGCLLLLVLYMCCTTLKQHTCCFKVLLPDGMMKAGLTPLIDCINLRPCC